jgi:hypothetical protein
MYWYVQSIAGKWRDDILVTLKFELWEVMLSVLNEYMVVPKHTNTGPPKTLILYYWSRFQM